MYSIGSSYLIRQSPGAERLGGVTIKLWLNQSGTPTRQVVFTDWKLNQPIADDIKTLAIAAEKGIEQFAAEHDIDLTQYSWELSKFAYHPIDSRPSTFQLAGYNAFASAWSTWNRLTGFALDKE
ncbi:MAG: hypothetical protein AB8G95_16875 [Anaerolineae bacterium]